MIRVEKISLVEKKYDQDTLDNCNGFKWSNINKSQMGKDLKNGKNYD